MEDGPDYSQALSLCGGVVQLRRDECSTPVPDRHEGSVLLLLQQGAPELGLACVYVEGIRTVVDRQSQDGRLQQTLLQSLERSELFDSRRLQFGRHALLKQVVSVPAILAKSLTNRR